MGEAAPPYLQDFMGGIVGFLRRHRFVRDRIQKIRFGLLPDLQPAEFRRNVRTVTIGVEDLLSRPLPRVEFADAWIAALLQVLRCLVQGVGEHLRAVRLAQGEPGV